MKGRLLFSALLAAASVVGAARSAEAAAVYYRDGKLYRNSVHDDPGEYHWEVGAKPCNYGAHEDVLGPIVERVRAEAPGYMITRGPGRNNNIDGSYTACGTSADAMVKDIRDSGLLPSGWRAFRVDSYDYFSEYGSTSHTAYMIEAPDGTGYLMDSYFYKCEITKMEKHDSPYTPVYFTPAEDRHNFAMKGYLQFVGGNFSCVWIIPKGDEQEYYRDQGKTLIKPFSGAITSFSSSYDPNTIYGPSGAGEARYIRGEGPLNYTIMCENLATASLAAVDVRIESSLDPAILDLGTFSLGNIVFGDREVEVPSDVQWFTTDVDLRPEQNLLVRIVAELDSATGLCRWQFNSLDPVTLSAPDDFWAGFLPPNVTPPAGEASVRFTVMPRPGLPTGTEILVGANIWFDLNAPIPTPVWVNTIDRTSPTSRILALPATIRAREINLRWTGVDAHSGVSLCSIFVREGDGPFFLHTTELAGNNTTFRGEYGKTYAFYSVTEDAAGNRESTPDAPQATTTLQQPSGGFGCFGRRAKQANTLSQGDVLLLVANAGLLLIPWRRRRPQVYLGRLFSASRNRCHELGGTCRKNRLDSHGD